MCGKVLKLFCQFLSDEKDSFDVSKLRAKDLRNLLLQKLNVDRARIEKILDRQELKELAEMLLSKRRDDLCFRTICITSIFGVCIIIVASIALRNYTTIKDIVAGLFYTIFPNNYIWQRKLKLLTVFSARKKRRIVGAISVLVSMILEVVLLWVQISALLSWIIPVGSTLRTFLFFGFSFQVGNAMLTNVSQAPDFNIDLGPVITLMVLRWVVSTLDNFSAQVYFGDDNKTTN